MFCLSSRIYLKPDQANPNTTLIMDIPATAAVSNQSSCDLPGSQGTQQILVLEWSDKDPDREDATLDRSFTFLFNINTTTGHYGVSKIDGVFEIKSSNGIDPKTKQTTVIKDIISITTFTMNALAFSVEINKLVFWSF